jgi:3'-phosphoadenosine 5'-phosphosulfate sulfotransferase (PAPS reductase)/FAD synthetase
MTRVISWFSCGANSAIATYLAIKKYGIDAVDIVYCDTGGEHPDNIRFLLDCEKWFGKKATILRNPKYIDHMDLWEKERFISSPQGARCTVELKKKLRFAYERLEDIQIFGYSSDEKHRAERFSENFPEVKTDFILLEKNLQKTDCIGLLAKNGIDLPEMYKLGFNNNNCIGCCKGGMGYWNHIRKHFPEQFKRASEIERKIGHSITDVYLDELEPNAGRHDINVPTCDFLCQSIDIDNL